MFATKVISEPCLLSSPSSTDESLLLSRSVPSIGSLSSSACDSGTASINPAFTARRNSRKGRPCRSCSWQDASPGVVIKFASTCDSILLLPNNLSRQDCNRLMRRSLTETDASSSAETLIVSPQRKLFRSQSINSIDRSFLQSVLQPKNRSLRPRSFSVTEVDMPSSSSSKFSDAIMMSSSQESFVNDSELLDIGGSDEGEGNNDSFSGPNRSSGNNKRKRFNAAGTSLAHLVPNRLLMRVSRRISSHSAADGCSCTSCHQTVTPYWRDGWAEDVMLCNACGLRFQKFAQRCLSCMYIPRKEDGVEDTCPQCQAPWEC